MFKKIILFVLVLFLAIPAAFADDNTIIPVLWLFNDLNFYKLYELKTPSSPNSTFYEDVIRTFEIDWYYNSWPSIIILSLPKNFLACSIISVSAAVTSSTLPSLYYILLILLGNILNFFVVFAL